MTRYCPVCDKWQRTKRIDIARRIVKCSECYTIWQIIWKKDSVERRIIKAGV